MLKPRPKCEKICRYFSLTFFFNLIYLKVFLFISNFFKKKIVWKYILITYFLIKRLTKTSLNPNWCIMCKESSKNMEHLFIHYKLANSLYIRLHNLLGQSSIHLQTSLLFALASSLTLLTRFIGQSKLKEIVAFSTKPTTIIWISRKPYASRLVVGLINLSYLRITALHLFL